MTPPAEQESASTSESRRLPHLELLVTLILMLVVQSFLETDHFITRTVFNLLLFAIVLSAIRSLSESRNRLFTAIAVGGIAYALSCLNEFRPSTSLVAGMMVGYITVYVILVIAISESVFRDGPVDLNRIIGAASIYIVLGLLWAFIYSLLETIEPGSFHFNPALPRAELVHDHVSEFMYFSNVTLTTLGYGDIVPVSRPARMFASLQAIVGQLYVAIIIGRLIGLHISQKR
jgi:hypothetical protein